jgi:hypothetical protein
LFFNYGVDTRTLWKSTPAHEPILWRHVIWDRRSPDREAKEQSPWGWLFYRRVKTGKAFYRKRPAKAITGSMRGSGATAGAWYSLRR